MKMSLQIINFYLTYTNCSRKYIVVIPIPTRHFPLGYTNSCLPIGVNVIIHNLSTQKLNKNIHQNRNNVTVV